MSDEYADENIRHKLALYRDGLRYSEYNVRNQAGTADFVRAAAEWIPRALERLQAPARGEMRRGWLLESWTYGKRHMTFVDQDPGPIARRQEIEWRYVEPAPPADEPVEPCCGVTPTTTSFYPLNEAPNVQLACPICDRRSPSRIDGRLARLQWNEMMRSARGGKA